MQDSTPDSVPTSSHTRERSLARCAACGTPVQGVTTIRPGTHRFVECGHSANSLRVFQAATAFDTFDRTASDESDSMLPIR